MKFLFLLFIPLFSHAQHYVCGSEYLKNKIGITATSAGQLPTPLSGKLSLQYPDSTYPVPVVFHFVLNEAQLQQLGGDAGIDERVKAQIIMMNKDFNAENEDTIKIPAAFKSSLGRVGIRFALAHTSPEGGSTPGYEIVNTANKGFEFVGNYGSTYAYCNAKYSASGGANAWDPTTYLNVWVVNTLNTGSAYNFLALTIPPSYTVNTGIPQEELGIVLHYGAIGTRTSASQYFVHTRDYGRTMTHELGHYFEIWHTWGDDDGLCPTNGGTDDGFADTPPQANFTNGCPSYPFYDACTGANTETSGVMFMNHMDYANDTCKAMFTAQQCAGMIRQIKPGAESYSLVSHPAVLQYPSADQQVETNYRLFPNPTKDFLYVDFSKTTTGLKSITITDITAGVIEQRMVGQMQRASYFFDLRSYSKGVYIMTLTFNERKYNNEILVY